MKCIHAYTPSRVTPGLVPFLNLSQQPDGTYRLTVRQDLTGEQVHIDLPWAECVMLADAIYLENRRKSAA